MTTILQNTQLRQIAFGRRVEKSTGTLAATTVPLFTITGGKIMLTSIVGEVTTAITVANSYKLQHNPTLAAAPTSDIVAATDVGTTDTPAGCLLGFSGVKTATIIGAGVAPTGGASEVAGLTQPLVMTAGQIESVSAGTDGVILWVVTFVPLDDGADLVAA